MRLLSTLVYTVLSCFTIAQNDKVLFESSPPISYIRDIPINYFTPNYKSHHGMIGDLTIYPNYNSNIGLYGLAGVSAILFNRIFELPENIYKYDEIDLDIYINKFKLFFGIKGQNRSAKSYFTPNYKIFMGWYFYRSGYTLRDVDSQIKYFEQKRTTFKNNNFIVGSGLGLDFNISKYWQDKNEKKSDGALFLGIGVEYYSTIREAEYIDNFSFTDYDPDSNQSSYNTLEFKSETLPFHKITNIKTNHMHTLGVSIRLVAKMY